MRSPIPRAHQARVETTFTALRIEGGLFPAEFLQRVASLAAPGQSTDDYAVPPGRSVRDEIGRYWTIAEALWREYRRDCGFQCKSPTYSDLKSASVPI